MGYAPTLSPPANSLYNALFGFGQDNAEANSWFRASPLCGAQELGFVGR